MTINVLLQQAKAELGVREYLFHVVMPLMARVGEYVARDEFSIGQEHALSAVVKYHLLQVFYLLSHSHAILKDGQSPKCFAIATTEGNLHEFGILVAAVLCALHGYPVFYLGPNLPADALAEATVAVQANCVILGLPPISGRSAENSLYIDRLLLCAPKLSELWIGGSPDYQAHGRGQGRLRQLPNLEELDRLLANIKQV